MTMTPKEYRDVFAQRPFEPLRVSLSDGREIVVRHPDQVLVLATHMIVGVSDVYPTPRPIETTDQPAETWIRVNYIHVVSVAPIEGGNGRRPKSQSSSS